MFYIIGPRPSAEAMARKNGLLLGEWRRVGRLEDVGALHMTSLDVILSTHDAYQLPDAVLIMDKIRMCRSEGEVA